MAPSSSSSYSNQSSGPNISNELQASENKPSLWVQQDTSRCTHFYFVQLCTSLLNDRTESFAPQTTSPCLATNTIECSVWKRRFISGISYWMGLHMLTTHIHIRILLIMIHNGYVNGWCVWIQTANFSRYINLRRFDLAKSCWTTIERKRMSEWSFFNVIS